MSAETATRRSKRLASQQQQETSAATGGGGEKKREEEQEADEDMSALPEEEEVVDSDEPDTDEEEEEEEEDGKDAKKEEGPERPVPTASEAKSLVLTPASRVFNSIKSLSDACPHVIYVGVVRPKLLADVPVHKFTALLEKHAAERLSEINAPREAQDVEHLTNISAPRRHRCQVYGARKGRREEGVRGRGVVPCGWSGRQARQPRRSRFRRGRPMQPGV